MDLGIKKVKLTDDSPEDFLDYALDHGFGDIHFKVDTKTGMKAIIAIHNTKLGPALGGCRFIEYSDSESAIYDAMRLARGMSYKSALVDLPLGGGKSVIMKPSGNFDRKGYMRSFGQFVNELNGRYITAVDSGTSLEDMDIIGNETPFIASLSRHGADPSPFTANGVFHGIQAAVAFKLGKKSLDGLHIAVQGLGHVGYSLIKHLHEAGANITVADINSERTEQARREFGAKVVSTDTIHTTPCDVFSPCALGGSINDGTLEGFQTNIIAGAANNQLSHTYHGIKLHEKGILYAPDYVINAGGLIFAASKYFDTPDDIMHEKLNTIYNSLTQIFTRSTAENLPTSTIADKIAEEKLRVC